MNATLPIPHRARSRAALTLLGWALGTAAFAAQPGLKQVGPLVIMTFPAAQSQAGDPVDYVNAQAKEMPIATNYSQELAQADLIGALSSPAARSGRSGFVAGRDGDGRSMPVFLGKPAKDSGGYTSQESGTKNHPFSTARADGATGSTNKIYPFRAAGKLFFTEGSAGTFVCSASLIKPGIVVTAAHCVAKFGAGQIYTNFRFAPGYKNGAAPYGNWTAKGVIVLAAYVNGTDTCSQSGVICKDDVALLVLNAQAGRLPGTSTGFYGYGWNSAGFTANNLTHLTQIGYPICLDNGEIMERNDSQGFKSASNANNTLLGSLMCGGSSGGPWLINFGQRPSLTDTTSGTSPQVNTVIGVTSWGSTSTGPKEQGASPFLDTNIMTMVNSACSANPGNC
jgi:V8-like Glu-specific endopeptidase